MDDYRPVDRDLACEQYGRLRVQTTDLGPARWLSEDPPGPGEFGTVASIAAPGFPAYARVLHPASLNERPVRWAVVAAAHGREVAAGSGWHELIGMDRDYHNASVYGLPGVWDEHPSEGPTPPTLARSLIPVLARHTQAADNCWFGLWIGYGRWDFDRFPHFEIPGREEVLLAGTLAEAVSPSSLDEFAELPDLWWPQDRAWCLGGDVDLVSTYIGGSPALIAELLAAPELEAYPVAPGDQVY
ncbi:hypothetical protein [Streptomyces albipurpureus]|uniref:Peptidase M15C domain-containing protein n=1 Tax=Streptomyces albipurpureus TaxID=2897419 RepID=A0ABT0ULX1_9ACTN|nr:hypothetical protein [Streptomyces sp. CWNU-1]MCM2388256.1 hypothetical protein [Streptomyces sp. CWNU-1]